MTSEIKSIAAVSVLSVASSETSSTVSSETPGSWSPTSWTATEVHEQRVAYRNHDGLIDACSRIERLPELVNCQTIEAVRGHFAAAARGEAFILIGGDCAENFADVQESIIAEKYNLLRDQASLIEAAIHVPVHILGRMAGQYAKPRSQVMETLQGGQVVHAFRGQNVNGFGIEERDPDPDRLLHGYLYAAATLNCLSRISESARRPVWTCHEALHLELETAQTKERYNTSAAFLWTGERTGQLNGAHLEYLHGIKNPLGVKIGPSATPEKVLGILEKFCRRHPSEEGRVTLITRFGANNVERVLPPLVQAVQESPFQVVWMSDPCHGNTISVGGVKTRVVTTMLEEVKKTIKILRSHGTDLGGLHLEQTGEAVYECIPDSTEECSPPEKNERYRTLCDPRLSGEQARILVREVAGLLGQGRPKNAARQRSWPPQFSAIMDTTIRKVNGVLGSPKRVPVA